MRLIIKMCLIAPLILGLTGCSNQKAAQPNSTEVNFKIVGIMDLSNKNSMLPDLETALNLLKKEQGVFSFSHDGDLIIFIGLGQKNTAGFDLEVVSINTSNDSKTYDIKVKEISPKPGSMVAQVITFPYILINMGKVGGDKEIRVLNEQGKSYSNLHYYLNPPRVEK